LLKVNFIEFKKGEDMQKSKSKVIESIIYDPPRESFIVFFANGNKKYLTKLSIYLFANDYGVRKKTTKKHSTATISVLCFKHHYDKISQLSSTTKKALQEIFNQSLNQLLNIN
jgi:hypothetical protein